MESMDMTAVLGTWEERYRVVMDASKKMLRTIRELQGEVSQLKQSLDKATDVIQRVSTEYPSVVQPCGCGESEACSSCEITFVLNKWQNERIEAQLHRANKFVDGLFQPTPEDVLDAPLDLPERLRDPAAVLDRILKQSQSE